MTGVASTKTEAIESLTAAVRMFQTSANDDVAETRVRMAAIEREVVAARDAARRAADRARVSLDECERTDDSDCSSAMRALLAADDMKARADQACRLVTSTAATLQLALARFDRHLAGASGDALQMLGSAQGALAGYASSGRSAGVGTVGGGPSSSGPRTRAVAGAPGIASVSLGDIDDSDRAIGPGDFGKGYSPADLTWAFGALEEVVLPALSAGKGSDYFAQRDAAEGRQGTRSYSDTFSGFFGGDSIRLERSQSGFRVTNGYHRIWVARQLGLSHVPAKVVS